MLIPLLLNIVARYILKWIVLLPITTILSINATDVSLLSDLEKCEIIAKSYCPGIQSFQKDQRGRFYYKLKKEQGKLYCTNYKNYDLENTQEYLTLLNNVLPSDILTQSYPFTRDFTSPLGEAIYSNDLSLPIQSKNFSPGRFRNDHLSKATYGKVASEVKNNLVLVKFLGKKVRFNKINGAAAALKRVQEELEESGLDKGITTVRDYAGTFIHRKISGSNRLSSHSFGTAIDLTPKDRSLSTYWKWSTVCRDGSNNCDKKDERNINVIPPISFDYFEIPGEGFIDKVVSIFEKNGFIWGGKWYHYDTMHFEYRTEFMKGHQECSLH